MTDMRLFSSVVMLNPVNMRFSGLVLLLPYLVGQVKAEVKRVVLHCYQAEVKRVVQHCYQACVLHSGYGCLGCRYN